jgi:hypothetical protein
MAKIEFMLFRSKLLFLFMYIFVLYFVHRMVLDFGCLAVTKRKNDLNFKCFDSLEFK